MDCVGCGDCVDCGGAGDGPAVAPNTDTCGPMAVDSLTDWTAGREGGLLGAQKNENEGAKPQDTFDGVSVPWDRTTNYRRNQEMEKFWRTAYHPEHREGPGWQVEVRRGWAQSSLRGRERVRHETRAKKHCKPPLANSTS